MSTRSNIGILNEDGTVDYIYCHWDGYVENNGKILNENYTTEKQVRELINQGDMSSLAKVISECKFYDDGEKARNVPYREYTKEHFESYVYLFAPDKGWDFRKHGTDYWTPLNIELF
jgi:hypothetical protein